MANDVGRPSVLDDEQVVLKIKEMYLDGMNEKSIAESMDIPYDTWVYWKWKSYQGFADKLLSYKHERILQKAETNIEALMSSDDERVKADVSKFALETLNKKYYSKRTEQTGADGKELPQPILNAYVLNNDKSQENISNVQEDTSSTGGDISIKDNINPIVAGSPISNGQGEEADIDSIGIDSSLETRGDARLQEHNDGSSILEGLELERNG